MLRFGLKLAIYIDVVIESVRILQAAEIILRVTVNAIHIIGITTPRVDISTKMNYSDDDLSIYPKEKVFK